MNFDISQEFVDELNYCNALIIKIQNLVAYMQPRMCSMITAPLRIEFDTSYNFQSEKGIIMASICFGVVRINLQNIKNFMGKAFYRDDCIVYISYLIGHELSHSDQLVNHSLYYKSDYHTWYIESAATYNSINFLTTHYEEIADVIGMNQSRYHALLEHIISLESKFEFQFSNTKIDTITLIDRYLQTAERRMIQEVRDSFIDALSSASDIYFYVYYVYELNNYIDSRNSLDLEKIKPFKISQCMIKRDNQFIPVDSDIINTIDYIDGFRAFMIDGNECNWYVSSYSNKNGDAKLFCFVKEILSYDNRMVGFRRE